MKICSVVLDLGYYQNCKELFGTSTGGKVKIAVFCWSRVHLTEIFSPVGFLCLQCNWAWLQAQHGRCPWTSEGSSCLFITSLVVLCKELTWESENWEGPTTTEKGKWRRKENINMFPGFQEETFLNNIKPGVAKLVRRSKMADGCGCDREMTGNKSRVMTPCGWALLWVRALHALISRMESKGRQTTFTASTQGSRSSDSGLPASCLKYTWQWI